MEMRRGKRADQIANAHVDFDFGQAGVEPGFGAHDGIAVDTAGHKDASVEYDFLRTGRGRVQSRAVGESYSGDASGSR